MGIRIARSRPILARILLSMALFSFFSLPYVGLFPAVAELNFGIDAGSPAYKWLYATWGLGACLGALGTGTLFAGVDKRRLITPGFLGFAASLAAFALVRVPAPAFPIGFVLGFCYFLTATGLLTVLQESIEDHERAVVMSLWFMAFGGTVPLGNLVFGPLMDHIGARWIMLGGARSRCSSPGGATSTRPGGGAQASSRAASRSRPATLLPLTSTASSPAIEPMIETATAVASPAEGMP